MAYERDDDIRNPYARDRDVGRDFGSGRDYTYSSAREYRAAGELRDRDDRNFRGGGTGYGDRDHRPSNQGGRETFDQGRDYYGGSSYDRSDDDRSRYGRRNVGQGHDGRFAGSYGSDRHRFLDAGGDDRGRQRERGGFGRQPEGYDYQDRGFVARAGDEVRSWFGDEEAERRREFDQRYDERLGSDRSFGRDADYNRWRKTQIDALDRDYHEYRQENAKKFESEFAGWRTNRQTQRQSLGSVREHMDVVGSDGAHVGTVDKVSGDRIILTKSDAAAGGRHHSIPCGWIQSVDDKVTITKSADDAKAHWRDEEDKGAMFGDKDRARDDGPVDLNRSFSGTY